MRDTDKIAAKGVNMATELRKFNEHETKAVRDALDYYIYKHTEKQSWAQRAILEGMLDKLWWESKS
jgi:hypothetical protein